MEERLSLCLPTMCVLKICVAFLEVITLSYFILLRTIVSAGERILVMAFLDIPPKRYFTTALADRLQSAKICPEWQLTESFRSQELNSNSLGSL